MNHSSLLVLAAILLFHSSNVKAQSPPFYYVPSSQTDANNFQPSIAVVIGILSIMFSSTFLLLLYAKFCRRATPNSIQIQDGLILPFTRSSSGIDKAVIESLPFFRFSLLKGSREGLECAVCLSKFEDVEILRLLPKCKHAFHINCIDQWLEKHSSCPLCRHKVCAEDHSSLTHSTSLRFLWSSQSELRQESNLELYVQREENGQSRSSSRFSIGNISFKKSEKGSKKEDELPIQKEYYNDQTEEQNRILDRFNHRIIVSDVVLKHRWSNVSSSDLMLLNAEMLNDMTSNRFSESRTNLESTSKVQRQVDKRSMSEILIYPRFDDFNSTRNCMREPCVVPNNVKEERRKRLWLPIARRTVQWFANKENTRQSFHV